MKKNAGSTGDSSAISRLISEALAIELMDAREAGAVGFMARAMVQATLPHRRAAGNEFTRRNGDYTLTMIAPSAVGLPYGSIPRLLLAWLSTEAVRNKSREVELGDTLSHFMQELDMVPTGGRWGSITRLKSQTERLFSSMVSCSYNNAETKKSAEMGYRIADKSMLWWDAKKPHQAGLWKSTVTLTEHFYNEVTNSPVTIDMRALKVLKKSPLALDLYCWLTYRMSYLRKPTEIPWPALERQFGSDYAHTRQFKAALLRELRKVLLVYPKAKATEGENGLLLEPGRSHVGGRVAKTFDV